MPRKITRRQQEFLGQFLDIYREMDHPLHYVKIAERLNLGKITVYEMLRLLEERGLVQSEYEMDSRPHGPGRPSVLFKPTEEARRAISQLAGSSAELEDWQAVKEQILLKVREGKANGYEDLAMELLSRISERNSPLIFITEIITTLLITMATISDAPQIHMILERLRRIGLPQEIGLSALSGIALAISGLERINRRSATILLTQFGKYEDILLQLSEENRRRLTEFTREVTQVLSG